MHTPPTAFLNIISCSKTGVFRIFAMLGTPKPMEEIALRHHKVFFLCLRHKNPSEKKFQKNRRRKMTPGRTPRPDRSCACALCPQDGGFGALPGGLGRQFFPKS